MGCNSSTSGPCQDELLGKTCLATLFTILRPVTAIGDYSVHRHNLLDSHHAQNLMSKQIPQKE